MLSLSKSKVAVVIGGSGDIGEKLVCYLAQEDIITIFTYKTNKEKADAVLKEVHGVSNQCFAFCVNITDENEVNSFFEDVYRRFGCIDILIHCAGTTSDAKTVDMQYEMWKKVIDTNLNSVFLCNRAAIQYMIREKYGRILNIGSVLGQTGAVGGANYSASKSALDGFSKSLAQEVARYGITVNVIALGFMNAGMGNRLPDKVIENVVKSIPMRRFGEIDHVARLILSFVSDEADYITGQVIGINGGYYM